MLCHRRCEIVVFDLNPGNESAIVKADGIKCNVESEQVEQYFRSSQTHNALQKKLVVSTFSSSACVLFEKSVFSVHVFL